MKKKARRSSAPNRSNKKNSSDSGCLWSAIKAVLMIGSASGHNGSEFPEYAASKGGVLAYTKNVAMRIAPY